MQMNWLYSGDRTSVTIICAIDNIDSDLFRSEYIIISSILVTAENHAMSPSFELAINNINYNTTSISSVSNLDSIGNINKLTFVNSYNSIISSTTDKDSIVRI